MAEAEADPMSAEMRELAKQIERDRIERARRMPIAEKLLASEKLFRMACETTKIGIRMQNPGIDEATVLQMLRERIQLGLKLEQHNVE